jgi:hypothetical protein
VTSSTMERYLGVVSPFLESPLVDHEARFRLQALARVLPPCSVAGLELRLRDDQPTVDFFVRLPYDTPAFDPSLLSHPVWQSVARLCGEIIDPASLAHTQVARIYVEFDLGDRPWAIPVPGLFLQLHEDKVCSAQEVMALVEPLAVHDAAPAVSSRALERCLQSLPDGTSAAHLGVMLSRPGAALRVVIHGFRPGSIAGYLESIGWRDPAGRFAALVDDIAPFADPIAMLDIDIADEVQPKVGVEFYVRGETDSRQRWEALLSFLTQRGLADSAKASAILGWPGWLQASTDDERWPENLGPGDLLLRGIARSVFWRNINHIKLGYQPSGEAEVKIYLGFGHNWFPNPPAPRAQ